MEFRLISLVFVLLLIITIFGTTPLEAQEQQPIIDMHLHANSVEGNPSAEPLTDLKTPETSAADAQPTLVIENGHVIIGNGTIFEQASVVVAGDSIYLVTQEPVEAPDARRIDASGKTVFPGLIDAHVHLIERHDSTATYEYLEEELPGVLRNFIENGVTTVRAMGDYWPWIGEV